METITFVVHGRSGASRGGNEPADQPHELPNATLKQSVAVGTLRGSDSPVNMTAEPGKDVVVLHLDNGPRLVLHPEHARALLMAQAGTMPAADAADAAAADGGGAVRGQAPSLLTVPPTLAWASQLEPAAQRGLFDKITLKRFDIFSMGSEVAADATARAVVAKVDAQVNPGVYVLAPGTLLPLKQSAAPLASVPAAPAGTPLLVLLHGTFSNTEGTFGKLWTQHPDLVQQLFRHYAGRVYALDHATLAESPIGNALMLAKALPAGANVHLLTHSRGGLVAEVLARACAIPDGADSGIGIFTGAAHARHREELAELLAVLKAKQIKVERIVRVACPARGTLLASKRLDAYISVLKWSLECAGIPVLPALVDFLGNVAANKSDPDTIPGLAAQMPDGPMVQWLHAAGAPIQGQLRVVAGDAAGDSVSSWIKTLLADSFYWTDNDFVVQTSSMYGGAARAAQASFVLDRGGKVSHFTYFSNPGTAAAVLRALTQDTPEGFRTIGPLSAAGRDTDGARGGKTAPDPNRPAVFVLPGILGSNLQVDGKRIWLGWRLINGLDDLTYDPQGDRVLPDGPVGLSYDKLCTFLAATHDVIEFAYDWRRPMQDEAIRLAQQVEEQMNLRQASGKPVRIVAHSMGGLVARVMQLERPDTWRRLVSTPGARVLMLGTPNGGSWAPMQVLSGDDTFGNALVAFGAPFQDGAARQLMATFPGFLQLQAGLLDSAQGLDQSARWSVLAARDQEIVRSKSFWHSLALQIRSFDWGIPPQQVLDQAVALRRRLDRQRDEGKLGSLVMVTGNAAFTPAGYAYDHKEGLRYLDAPDHGDGRVTLGSAMLPGVPCFSLNCEHGNLADADNAFPAYLQLLENGTSSLLTQLDAGAVKAPLASDLVPNRASRKAAAPGPAVFDGLSPLSALGRPAQEQQVPLAVTIVNGNIKFVRQPIMLGHYRSLLLTGAEKVMDGLIGGSMSRSIRMGVYPDALRSHQVFLNLGESVENPFQLPRPEAVIVVGLGYEGDLKAAQITQTVTLGVIAWAQRLAELHFTKPEDFELAATLLGSGGSGISVGAAARAIAQGVRDANRSLAASQWPQVRHLHLVEMYLDRATDAWRSLGLLAASTGGAFQLTPQIAVGTGAHRRALDTGYRGTTYDLLTATTDDTVAGRVRIIYTLDTKRAREDVRAQGMQAPLVDMLIRSASNGNNNDPELGFTLFKLLVPPEMEPFLGGTSDMQIQLDKGTAAIPWEMLNTRSGTRVDSEPDPWAIRVKLLRTLRTSEFAQTVLDASKDDGILVIGEPLCDSSLYPPLPGARREALAVVRTFANAGQGGKTVQLIAETEDGMGPDAFAFVSAMFSRDWRVVHIAGHGAARDDKGDGGVVLSDGTFFGPNEINTMRVVPALVFINCCHLGALDQSRLLKKDAPANYNRPAFAATVAEALIEKGVRCVIAAGWAVNDSAASLFATTFYDQLLRGARFIDAVADARKATFDLGGNTWAAYQCYGDPDWTFQARHEGRAGAGTSVSEEFAGVCSAPGLILALESIVTATRYQDFDYSDSAAKVRYLEQTFGGRFGAVGAVAEAFGLAWAEARDLRKAIEWHELALQANDASASVKAVEQLGNLLARTAWEEVRDSLDMDSSKGPVSADLAAKARTAIERGVALLDKIVDIQATQERYSLCASAYKRLAMLEQVAGKRADARPALQKMAQYYRDAEQIGIAGGLSDWCYPALNRLAAELAQKAGPKPGKLDDADVLAIGRCLDRKIETDPDFYCIAGRIELAFQQALVQGELALQAGTLLAQVDDLYRRVQAPRWWNSVRDQLDFMYFQCNGRLAKGESGALDRIRRRLFEIAPRSRT